MTHFLFQVGPLLQHPSLTSQHYQRHLFKNGNIAIQLNPSEQNPLRSSILFFDHFPANNQALLELGFLANTLKREYDCPITCWIRYLQYCRSNRINEKNISFGAKVYIHLLCNLDIDRFVVFDLHAPELLGFFNRPVVQISMLPSFCKFYKEKGIEFDYVIGPDCGRSDDCFSLSAALNAEMDFFPKIRKNHDGISKIQVPHRAHLRGKRVLLFDDEITSGQTMLNAIEQLVFNEVESIHLAVVYCFCSQDVFKQLQQFPQVISFTTTNLATPFSRIGNASLEYHILDCTPFFAL